MTCRVWRPPRETLVSVTHVMRSSIFVRRVVVRRGVTTLGCTMLQSVMMEMRALMWLDWWVRRGSLT